MFALIFILSSRHVSDVKAYISNTYGKDGLDLFHLLLDTKRKFEKCKLDLAFLERCKVYNVFPKFLRFKLYKRALQHTSFYRSWQAKLLNREMQEKRKNVETLDKFVNKEISKFVEGSKKIQFKKLESLGIHNELAPLDPEKVIHNYSSVTIPSRIKYLLAFGLDFCLPTFKLDYFRYFLNFESFMNRLKYHDAIDNFSRLCQDIKSIAHK